MTLERGLAKIERPMAFTADVIGIGTFVAAVITGGVAFLAPVPDWVKFVLGGVALTLFGAAAGAAVAWLLYSRGLAAQGYRWVRVEQTYELDEDNPRVQRLISEIKIKATRNNVFLFVDRTHWTGVLPPRLSLLSRNQTLVVSEDVFEGWRTFYVHFNNPLIKGEEATIKLQVEFIDVSPDPSHWVSKTPLEPIKEMKLRVVLGRNSPTEDAYTARVMRPGVGRNATVDRLSVEFEGQPPVASTTVKRPRVGLRYQMQVEYPYPNDLGDPHQATPSWRR
jgi:membrane protein implicated in regulation of membrane protease activity